MANNRLLGQARPSSTTAVTIYSANEQKAIITSIIVCNTTSPVTKFRIFVDDDGTTYDESTATHFDVTLAGNSTLMIDTQWALNNSAGSIGVRTSKANALTFTVFGAGI